MGIRNITHNLKNPFDNPSNRDEWDLLYGSDSERTIPDNVENILNASLRKSGTKTTIIDSHQSKDYNQVNISTKRRSKHVHFDMSSTQ